MKQPFKLKINDLTHLFETSKSFDNFIFNTLFWEVLLIFFLFLVDANNLDYQNDIDGIKTLVAKLYLNLNIEEHERNAEQNIAKEIESLKNELEPLEKVKK